MFDKVSQLAEKVATTVSRRAFLGGLGQGALATVGVVGGMLAFGGEARADSCPPVACVSGLEACPATRRTPGFCCPKNCHCYAGFSSIGGIYYFCAHHR